jgi:tetratricopeptide (TPR) repeat protein
MPAVLIVLTIALVYSLNAKPIFANRSIIRALTIQNTTPEQSLDHFRKALSYDTFANVEAVEQMFNQFSRFATAGVSAETQKAYASTVIEAMEGEISAHPNNVRLTLFAGSFLNRLGDHDNARLYLERAREMSPKKQNILFELGFAHLSKAEYDKAFEYFKTAYDSAPDFTESKVLLIIGSLYNSNDSLADELISTLDENVFLNDERIVAAFAGTGNIGEAVKIMERRVELNPQNVDLRFRLSAGYLMMEQRSKSIETLRGIVNEFPAGKERAEYYIKEIQAGRNP